MTSTSTTSFQDLAATQTSHLIRLLESLDYPYEIPPEAIQALQVELLLNHTLRDSRASSATTTNTPLGHFLGWLLETASAQGQHDGGPEDEQQHEEAELEALDWEQLRLEHTLSGLESKLDGIKDLEAESLDADQSLESEVHNTSVQFDTVINHLGQTAVEVLGHHTHACRHYNSNSINNSNGAHQHGLDSNQDSNQFVHQCKAQLVRIQQLDKAFLKSMDLVYKSIQRSTAPLSINHHHNHHNYSTTHNDISPSLAVFDQLLKRDPDQDKELVRLCSLYRSTKMSHIRAMAQLQSLEHELAYMEALDLQIQKEAAAASAKESGRGSGGGGVGGAAAESEEDLTGDHMYTIASFKNKALQQARKDEIELISVQREIARLAEEMEQLLSEPSAISSAFLSSSPPPPLRLQGPPSNTFTTTSSSSSSSLQPSSTMTRDGYNQTSSDQQRGVLVDICEKIAHSDLELQFLSAVHRDRIQELEQAVKDIDQAVEWLLEYYSQGAVVEQVLQIEKDTIREHKNILWAAILELQEPF